MARRLSFRAGKRLLSLKTVSLMQLGDYTNAPFAIWYHIKVISSQHVCFVMMNICCAPVQDETSLHWLVDDEKDQSNQFPEPQFSKHNAYFLGPRANLVLGLIHTISSRLNANDSFHVPCLLVIIQKWPYRTFDVRISTIPSCDTLNSVSVFTWLEVLYWLQQQVFSRSKIHAREIVVVASALSFLVLLLMCRMMHICLPVK